MCPGERRCDVFLIWVNVSEAYFCQSSRVIASVGQSAAHVSARPSLLPGGLILGGGIFFAREFPRHTTEYPALTDRCFRFAAHKVELDSFSHEGRRRVRPVGGFADYPARGC